MFVAIEGTAGAGKSTLRDRILTATAAAGMPASHIGQFSWLSLPATRTLIKLRAGRPAPSVDDTVRAARRDLALHCRFNLAPALLDGPVLADRFLLSTACLIALLHDCSVADVTTHLANQLSIFPQLTILLTTSPAICHDRLALRPTARRATEHRDAANRLSELYPQAATAWTTATGLPVVQHACTTTDDLDALTELCIASLGNEHSTAAARETRR